MAVLEAVVVEGAAEGETAGEGASFEEGEGFGAGNLVDVGDDDDVAACGRLRALELGEDLGKHGVSLEVFAVPGSLGVEVGWVVNLVVDDFGSVRGEFGKIVV